MARRTSESPLLGVPGIEPWAEFVRVRGGLSSLRPKLSNLAGEAVRFTAADAEATRWWWRFSCVLGVTGPAVVVVIEVVDVVVVVVPFALWCVTVLLTLTRAAAASGSCDDVVG